MPDSLLKDGEHDAHEDAHEAEGEELLFLLGDGVPDVGKGLSGHRDAVDAREDGQRLVVLSLHDQVARGLRHQADEQGEQARRHAFRTEHVAPARTDGPRITARQHGREALTDRLDQRIGMVAKDEKVDEINDKLSEDNGKLVETHQHAADIAGGDLADIHRADGRRHAYADAAEDTIEIERHQESIGGLAIRQQAERLRFHTSPCRDEEAHAGKDQRPLTAETRGKEAGKARTDDATDERRRRREAVHEVRVPEIGGAEEESLQALLSARYDGRVVAEEQAA